MPRIFGRGRNPPAPQDRQVDGIPLAEVVESRGMRVASLSTADQQDWEVVHGYADGVIDGVPVVVEPFAAGASDYAYAVAVPISPGVGALGPMGAVVEMGVFAPHRALGIVDGADDGEGVVIDSTIRRIVTRELVSNGHPLIGPMMVNRMLFLRTAWQGLRAQDLIALASSSRIFHRYIAPLHALWRHVLILEHWLVMRDGAPETRIHRPLAVDRVIGPGRVLTPPDDWEGEYASGATVRDICSGSMDCETLREVYRHHSNYAIIREDEEAFTECAVLVSTVALLVWENNRGERERIAAAAHATRDAAMRAKNARRVKCVRVSTSSSISYFALLLGVIGTLILNMIATYCAGTPQAYLGYARFDARDRCPWMHDDSAVFSWWHGATANASDTTGGGPPPAGWPTPTPTSTLTQFPTPAAFTRFPTSAGQTHYPTSATTLYPTSYPTKFPTSYPIHAGYKPTRTPTSMNDRNWPTRERLLEPHLNWDYAALEGSRDQEIGVALFSNPYLIALPLFLGCVVFYLQTLVVSAVFCCKCSRGTLRVCESFGEIWCPATLKSCDGEGRCDPYNDKICEPLLFKPWAGISRCCLKCVEIIDAKSGVHGDDLWARWNNDIVPPRSDGDDNHEATAKELFHEESSASHARRMAYIVTELPLEDAFLNLSDGGGAFTRWFEMAQTCVFTFLIFAAFWLLPLAFPMAVFGQAWALARIRDGDGALPPIWGSGIIADQVHNIPFLVIGVSSCVYLFQFLVRNKNFGMAGAGEGATFNLFQMLFYTVLLTIAVPLLWMSEGYGVTKDDAPKDTRGFRKLGAEAEIWWPGENKAASGLYALPGYWRTNIDDAGGRLVPLFLQAIIPCVVLPFLQIWIGHKDLFVAISLEPADGGHGKKSTPCIHTYWHCMQHVSCDRWKVGDAICPSQLRGFGNLINLFSKVIKGCLMMIFTVLPYLIQIVIPGLLFGPEIGIISLMTNAFTREQIQKQDKNSSPANCRWMYVKTSSSSSRGRKVKCLWQTLHIAHVTAPSPNFTEAHVLLFSSWLLAVLVTCLLLSIVTVDCTNEAQDDENRWCGKCRCPGDPRRCRKRCGDSGGPSRRRTLLSIVVGFFISKFKHDPEPG